MSAARVQKALQESKRLPPEDLLLVAEKSMAMVAHYEPGTPEKPNPFENEERYAYWLAQAREALKVAAPYYAPKLHAIAYAPMQTDEDKAKRVDPRVVMFEHGNAAARRIGARDKCRAETSSCDSGRAAEARGESAGG
jgi:hypothetical protein